MDITAKIKFSRKRIKTANGRQEQYTNWRRWELSFEARDKELLKISPMKGVTRFGQWNKLAPRCISPYEILEKVGKVAYQLALPPCLSQVHDVFHVSLLRKCLMYPWQVIDPTSATIREDLSYKEVPVRILDRKVIKLRTKWIPMVKILWSNHSAVRAAGRQNRIWLTNTLQNLKSYERIWWTKFLEEGRMLEPSTELRINGWS